MTVSISSTACRVQRMLWLEINYLFCSRIRGVLENQRILPQFSHSSVTGLNMDTAKTMLNGRVRVNRLWPQWLHVMTFPANSYSAGIREIDAFASFANLPNSVIFFLSNDEIG
jgi:hypothetical protein